MSPAWRRAERPVVAALALAALAAALLVPTYPNYDTYFHLVWGRELLHGAAPGFEDYAAPTQHPLWVAVCALVGLVGADGDRVLVVICALSLVALAWATFRVGAACFGPWPGLAAAAFVGSSFALLLLAARAYLDVPFLALVLWAAAIETRSPGREHGGRGVICLLAVAGLLRPEAWVLAGAYWLWCGPRRLDLLALAAAAPLTWAAIDLAVTGDPLFSLHATSALADELDRARGIGAVPGAFVRYVADTARVPVAAAGVVGALLAWRLGAGRSRHVPVALFAAGAITFAATGAAGLSVIPRYLTVPVIAVCLLAGYAALGFTTLPAGRLRLLWTRAAIAGAVLGIAFLAIKAPVFGRLADELRFLRDSHRDLVAIVERPAVARARRCGALTFPTYRLVPDARWLLDAPAGQVAARSVVPAGRGPAIYVTGDKSVRRLGHAAGVSRRTNVQPAAATPIARAGRFVAYASCPQR